MHMWTLWFIIHQLNTCSRPARNRSTFSFFLQSPRDATVRLSITFQLLFSFFDIHAFSLSQLITPQSREMNFSSPFLHRTEQAINDNLQRDWLESMNLWCKIVYMEMNLSRGTKNLNAREKMRCSELNNDTNKRIAIYIWQLNILQGFWQLGLKYSCAHMDANWN